MATNIERIKQPVGGQVHIRDNTRRTINKLMRALSRVVAYKEDTVFETREWPLLWPKK